MVQVRAVRKGLDFDQIAKDLEQDVQELKADFMGSMAEVIAQTSPIDSGNYARSHEVALRSGSFVARKQRPDSDSRISREGSPQYPNARQEGEQAMKADIASIDLSKNTFVFRNPMTYASLVEAEHAVYAQAKREVTALLMQSVANVRNRR